MSKVKVPQNIHELRYSLCQIYADMLNDDQEIAKANAAANLSNQILKSVALEQEQMRLSRQVQEVDFLIQNQKELANQAKKNLLVDEFNK